MPAPHPRARLVDLLQHPVRFSLAAALAHADSMEFREARDLLQVSDSVLSKQASQLEAADLVRIRKGHVGKRPRTWLSLTPEGHEKWRQHLRALQDIAEGRAP